MANLNWTRSGGVWATDTDLLAAELADLDSKTVRAVSGEGGSYYLDDDMVWTGDVNAVFDVGVEAIFRDDVTVESDTFLTGPVYVYGSTGFYAPTFFDQEAEFNDNLTANNDVFLIGGTLVYGGIGFYSGTYFEAGSDPEFNAPATFNSSVTLNGGPFITNVVTVLGDSTHAVQLRGPTSLNDKLTMTGTGSIAHRVVAGDNVTTTYSPLAVHEVIMDPGVSGGSADWYIDDTGCVDGNEILFGNKDGTISMDVRRPGGFSLATLIADWARFVRRNGVWELAQKGSY